MKIVLFVIGLTKLLKMFVKIYIFMYAQYVFLIIWRDLNGILSLI